LVSGSLTDTAARVRRHATTAGILLRLAPAALPGKEKWVGVLATPDPAQTNVEVRAMCSVPKPKAPMQRTFAVTFSIEGTDYGVSPLDCDPSIGSAAFRFAKEGGDGAVYDVCLRPFGWECQCLGFLRYGYCKHVRTLQKAGQLFGNHQRVTDEQLAEAMEHAPVDPPPTEEEVNEMARYFGQE
jgi:hypothetical protein